MDLQLKGKTAAITASSKGLGRAIAEKLAEEGANLILCSRDQAAVGRAAEEIRNKYGVEAEGYQADLSRAEEVRIFIERAVAKTGKIDALLCNAGGPPSGSFLSMDDDMWEKAFQTNMMSTVRLIRGFFPYLKESRGRVLTIASISAKTPIPGLVLSNTLRAGVLGLMKTLSIEFGEHGILVNTISPGRISTDRIDELDQARAERENKSIEEIRENMIKNIPLGRSGEPHEFAALAAFLLSPVNSYMTGSTFFVDGGSVKSL